MGAVVNALRSVAPDVVARTQPLVKSAMNYFFRSGYKAAESLGQFGPDLAAILKDQTVYEGVKGGQFLDLGVKAMDGVSQDIAVRLKTQPNLAPQNWNQLQMAYKYIGSELTNKGAKVTVQGQKVPFFVPQNFHPNVIVEKALEPGVMRQELIDHLVSSGQMKRLEAEDFVAQAKGMTHGLTGLDFMHTLKGIQIPDRFLEQDPKVAYGVWSQTAARFLTKQEVYGHKYANLKAIVDAIGNDEGHTALETARNIVDMHEYGNGHVGGQKFYEGKTEWENAIKRYEGLTKLSRIAIAEPSQNLNPLLLTNIKSIIKGIKDIATDYDNAYDFTLKSGILNSETLRDFKRLNHGFPYWADALMQYTGFNAERKFGLMLSANAIKNYTIELGDRLVLNASDKEANLFLRQLGVEPTAVLRRGGQLTQDELLEAARRGTGMTQFIHDPLDLPILWGKNPWMRTAMLYKSFIFNQAKFMKDVMGQSVKAGKYQNIAYLALLFPVVGELVGDAETLAQGKNPNDRVEEGTWARDMFGNEYLARYVENLSRIGSIGMFSSILSAVHRGNISQWLAGPLAGDLEDMTRVGKNIIGGDFKKAGGTVVQRVPVVGTALKNLTKEE